MQTFKLNIYIIAGFATNGLEIAYRIHETCYVVQSTICSKIANISDVYSPYPTTIAIFP